ncbi:NHL repeat-containing protein [Flavivirga algicola]|uniref:6-bladed beta-propeller n=1 Tax=Flavivirga algicola TaxID=2729136 RepID=A0ABX1RYY0_9FLAO|nr:6-bladed beta-propeller [Flavivirga algicola]NMH87535.1 6-bladed beta-propeller [Flavivirga algicola]
MQKTSIGRRNFIKSSSIITVGTVLAPTTMSSFNILPSKPELSKDIIGHGDYRYRVEKNWSDLNPKNHPVKNCHEMVMDRKKRLFLLTDHPKNNVLVYDKSGKLINSWTLHLKGAHGLTIHDENGSEFLYITDPSNGRVLKTTLNGHIVLEIKNPQEAGVYSKYKPYKPTETAIGPNGDIYVADGYGSQFILQYNGKGEFIRKFGGDSFLQPDKFKQAHGVALDTRDPNNPTLICSARIKNSYKRFSLDGNYIESYYIPGAFISRPVIDGDDIYSAVCFGMEKDNYNMMMNKGFVTIMNKENIVVSNPGGSKPKYKNGKLDLILQKEPVFKQCHDVCVDDDKNLYVCQWNAGGVYPYKLHRV